MKFSDTYSVLCFLANALSHFKSKRSALTIDFHVRVGKVAYPSLTCRAMTGRVALRWFPVKLNAMNQTH